MNEVTLVVLEKAIEPYRNAGFVITSQSEGAITLVAPPAKFKYLVFIFTLLVFWPLAIVYLITFSNRRDRSVCLRVTSEGNIEESGYTLKLAEKERRHEHWVNIALFSIALILILAMILLLIVRWLARR